MSQIPFSVSARTAQLIGQQNFSTAEGAVIELVKNCYDADAKNAIILFDNLDQDPLNRALFIFDNGDGMTERIILDHWMMIGTDNKEDDFETGSGRIKTGAKGIGRFALDRLGVTSEMFTLPKNEDNGYYWKVNWNDFKRKGISISEVTATLEILPEFDYKKKVFELSDNFPQIQTFFSEKNIDLTKGTVIKISGLKEQWTNEEISSLFESLEILIPPREQPIFNISLFSKQSPNEYGELSGVYYDDFDYKLSAEYLDNETKSVVISIERNELDIKKIEKEYMDVFSMPQMRNSPFDFESFKKQKVEYSIRLNELVKGQTDVDKSDLLNKIGKFGFAFYFLKNTKSDDKSESNTQKYPYKEFNSATRKAWLKKFGGVKIFRDDFRVRPYGEYGQDWLKLGERQAQSPQGAGQRIGAYRIRPNQISGTINISRITNISFQDKSGREGIQENEVFDLFKSLILGIISQFEKDRNIIMYSFSELSKKRNAEDEAKRKAAEEAKRVLDDQRRVEQQDQNASRSNSPNVSTPTETEVTLAKGIQAQVEEIEEKDNEIRLLRSLSGTGLIVASFAHELRSIRTLLVSRTDDLKDVLHKHLVAKEIIKLPLEENPFSMLNHMREQDVQIKHWLDYSLSALKKDKRTRSNLDIAEYFKSFKENWDNALKRRKVSFFILNKLKRQIQIKAFAIDFDTLFNNLLINSLDSFKRRKDNHIRQVTVSFEVDSPFLKIFFSDTGAGLSKDYIQKPEDIFLPFETSKVDKRGNKIGTGLGMYLAKSIVEDYKGEIEILETTDGFKLGIYLPIEKNK
ncbi:ATP-binding protein [Haliscomenobacter hydrossis]|uniref:histidine kinase n=1 Tax=Haliscomenobacter hydrossis (strain ATCC 27775 / DSM 1100 / LMG 10767 / O) TaxID=760192 RepID=F4KZT1_HALH1|nr:ATP-binding protein [Haliscomenobacter hydrossis]AEE50517.1 histidine kinase [Haliscomenobacter hydrossis DSM 1100]